MANIEPGGHGRDEDDLWRTLTDRATRLFASRCERDGRDYSDKAFAELILKETGERVSHTWIWELRNGKLTNATVRYVAILARFFGVPVKYFFDPDERAAKRVEAELELLAEMKQADIQSIAALGAGLSPSSLVVGQARDRVAPETIHAITEMLRDARLAQGSEAEPGPTSPPVEG